MSELVAKRWAKALVELTEEDKGISKEDVLDNLREVSENVSMSEELREVINNPSISTEEKQLVLSKLFQSKLMPIVYNFLYALNLKKRLGLIAEITDEFQKEIEVLNNVVRVSVVSAIEISNDKKENIKAKIAEKLRKDVKVEWAIDADIIAGLIFNINDTVVDNSVKHKLDKLSENIAKI